MICELPLLVTGRRTRWNPPSPGRAASGHRPCAHAPSPGGAPDPDSLAATPSTQHRVASSVGRAESSRQEQLKKPFLLTLLTEFITTRRELLKSSQENQPRLQNPRPRILQGIRQSDHTQLFMGSNPVLPCVPTTHLTDAQCEVAA